MIKSRFIPVLLFLVFVAYWPGERTVHELRGQKEPLCSTISEPSRFLETEGLESIAGQIQPNLFPRHLSKFKKDAFIGSSSASLSLSESAFLSFYYIRTPRTLEIPLFLFNRSILI